MNIANIYHLILGVNTAKDHSANNGIVVETWTMSQTQRLQRQQPFKSGRSERARLATYLQGAEELPVPSLSASFAGFIRSSSSDGGSNVKCHLCGLELSNLDRGASLLAWHRALFSACPFLQQVNGVNNTFLDDSNRAGLPPALLPAGNGGNTQHVTSTSAADRREADVTVNAPAALESHVTVQERPAEDPSITSATAADDELTTAVKEAYRSYNICRYEKSIDCW